MKLQTLSTSRKRLIRDSLTIPRAKYGTDNRVQIQLDYEKDDILPNDYGRGQNNIGVNYNSPIGSHTTSTNNTNTVSI